MERLDKLNKLKRDQSSANMRPRDAASVLIVDDRDDFPRVLMGKRNAKQIFMPSKFVFPGGRVDNSDKRLAANLPVPHPDRDRLTFDMKGAKKQEQAEGRALALALAAIRETFEETGLLLGSKVGSDVPVKHPSWDAFGALGASPVPDQLTFMARAITPPRRPRRYDTRFFVASYASALNDFGDGDGELTDLQWVNLDEALTLDIAPITRVIIEELADRLKAGSLHDKSMPVPYYFYRHGTFRRELIA